MKRVSQRRSHQHYAAFLRGVSPMNARMPALQSAFEAAGFTHVKTVLSSGNVVFTAGAVALATIERQAEESMTARMSRSFLTIVRSVDQLREVLASYPFDVRRLPPGAKPLVTFLRDEPKSSPSLPLEHRDAAILRLEGRHAFSFYVPGPGAAGFMPLIEKIFGRAVTTRTLETVKKVIRQSERLAGLNA